jgi:hypothetical protein
MIKLLGLSTLLQVVGMTLQQFSTSSLLNAFPLCVTIAATINWILPQQERYSSNPDNEEEIHLPQRVAGSDAAEVRATNDLRLSRRDSHNNRERLPHPDVFSIGGNAETDPLRSDALVNDRRHQLARHNRVSIPPKPLAEGHPADRPIG